MADETKPALNGSLSIKANVYFGDESEETEAVETSFYLLKDNLVTILKKAKFEPIDENDNLLTDVEAFLTATAKAFIDDEENSLFVSVLLNDNISRNKVAQITTNQSGLGSLKTVTVGNYYLFGMKRVEDEVFIWHHPIQIKSGKNRIELDQHNAEVVLSE
ncbi:MAG TPA: hypothetical protein VF596_18470 [Pyrinomonadaceae bacterium]